MKITSECPQFDSCSTNLCPLDPDVLTRDALPDDPKCGALRRTREAIAAKYTGMLPWAGVLPSERAKDVLRAKGKAAWEALSADEKARRVANLIPKTRQTNPTPPFAAGRGT